MLGMLAADGFCAVEAGGWGSGPYSDMSAQPPEVSQSRLQ